MKSDSTQEIALVTGATRGIGRAIARELAKAGMRVYGTATSDGGAESIGEDLAEFEGRGVVLDVTDGDQVDTLIKRIGDECGAVTVLVNNAGITDDNLLMRMKEDQWGRVIDTDLGSVYRLSRACLRGMMKARHGRIINIASVVGLMGNPGQTNYAAAKAGVLGFTRSLAQEVGSRHITVNAVAPGYIATEMTEALDEGQRDAIAERVALGRLGQPEDIAAAVAFLASPAAAYITGETLNVSGGLYMN
ncbi:MAG: 3-oxoacyl-ACP reductase FabG [Pseudomonadota bacterium]